jgi:hypothetical protein
MCKKLNGISPLAISPRCMAISPFHPIPIVSQIGFVLRFFLLAVCELVEEGEVKRQLSSRFRGRMLAGNVQQSFKDVEKLEIDSRMNESFKWDLRGMDSSCEDERRLFGNVVNSANGCELLSCQWLRSCGRVSGGTLA